MYVNADNVTYFDGFAVAYNPKEITKFKNVATNIYRIQANDSIICWYVFIGFIDFMLKGKCFSDYINLVFANEYEKNDKIILEYFQ